MDRLLLVVVAVAVSLDHRDTARDYVDLIEVNHVYDDGGRYVLTQAVFYDWRPQQGEYRIRAWRLIKAESHRPMRDFARGGWTMIFHDGGLLREVRAIAFRETWTQYDPEREARSRLPAAERRGLLGERGR